MPARKRRKTGVNMNIKKLLEIGTEELIDKKIDDFNLKSRILLSFYLKKPKEYLYSHDDEKVEKDIEEKFLKGLKKLESNVPIQYIINHQEFYGLDFYVDENVLIPQPDTEILVEEVLNLIKDNDKILDLCTGSGAIGISIKKYRENTEVFVSDVSDKALEIARKNAINNDVNIDLIESDLFNNINEKDFDIIVSNPPYIETDVIRILPKEVKNEPVLALDGGIDGLDFYRKIAKGAKEYLKESGYLCLEIGYNQREEVIDILNKNNYNLVCVKRDFSGNDRAIIAKKKG